MGNIIDDLNNLTDEELEAVGRLINKFVKRKKSPEKPKKAPKTEHGPGRKAPRNLKSKGRTEPRQARNKRLANGPKNRPRKGVAARTEPVQISGENKFFQMRERNAERKDSKIDQKLWSNREPSQRPEKFEFVEVQCIDCQLWFDAHPNLIFIDPDTKQPYFRCNDCSQNPRG